MSDLDISVIVPSYNAERTIRACLSSLLGQKTSARYEIIVVDSSDASDLTSKIVAELGARPKVRLIRLPERALPGAARNIGIKEAQSDILAFIDADAFAAEDWLETILEFHLSRAGEDKYVGVCGSIAPANPESRLGFASHLIQFSEFLPGARPRATVNLPAVNSSFKRQIFEKYGGFMADAAMSEDRLFGWELCKRSGSMIFFEPRMRVFHFNRESWPDFSAHLYRHGCWAALARRLGPARNLPGAWVAERPLFVPLVVPVRLARILKRAFLADKRVFIRALLMLPLLALGLSVWAYGFWDGAQAKGPRA